MGTNEADSRSPRTHGSRLSFDTRREDGDAVVFRVAGEMDLDSLTPLREALDEAVTAAPAVLVVDLADVTFCDSSGLNTLLQVRLLAVEAGSALRLAAVPQVMARLFELTGADTVFSIHTSTQDALAAP